MLFDPVCIRAYCSIQQTRRVCKMKRFFTRMARLKRALTFLPAAALVVALAACANPSGGEDPAEYTITFDSQGGSAVQVITAAEGTAVEKPADPTWDGHTFEGWYSAATGGVKYEWPHTLAADVTMHARWQENAPPPPAQHTITFDSHGGTAVAAITADAGTAVAKPTDPTRDDYDFQGWHSAATGGTLYAWPYELTAAVTMHAQWREKTLPPPVYYTLAFDSHGGSEVDSLTAAAGTVVEKPADPKRDNYTFEGWYSAATGGVQYEWPHTLSARATMHAHWKAIPRYTLTFDSHGGATVAAITAKEGTEVEQPADPARNGYAFSGWFAAATGGEAYAWPHALTASLTLHAQWTPIVYTVEYNANNGTGTMVPSSYAYGTATALDANLFVRTGYTFAGWNTQADGSGTSYTDGHSVSNLTVVDGAVVILYAQWKGIPYTVAYDANGGTGTTASSVHTYGEAKALTANGFARAGNAFTGWAAQADGNGSRYADRHSVSNLSSAAGATVTLYAQWSVSYAISYTLNGGDDTKNPDYYTAESLPLKLAPPTQPGYTGSWYDNAALAGPAVTVIPAGSTGDRDFYAGSYTADIYTITYNLDGGTNDGGNPGTYTIEDATIALMDPLSRVGYSFAGWHSNSGFSGNPVVEIPAGSTGNKTFYAKWSPIIYTITYNLSGGTNPENSPTSYTIESLSVTLPIPTKTNYIFGGWFDNSSFAGTAVAAIAVGSTGDKRFWVKWNESGLMGITIFYWVNEQDQISSTASSATVPKSGASLIIAADGFGYSEQHWSVNGVEDASQAGQASYSFSGAGKDTKTYTVGLRVKKGNQYYSTQFAVTVTD
jgi:uncharacterized repeat protein (TIGR02543 family)